MPIRASDRIERILTATLSSAHDLSLQSFEVLLFLTAFSGNGQMSMTDLTRRAPLSQSRVSRLVADLEHRELVARNRHPEDRRGVMVSITDAGVAMFHAAQAIHLVDLEQHLFALLTDDEIQQLANITHKILNPPPPEPPRFSDSNW